MTPEPPEPFDPLLETIPAGTLLYRVHEPFLPGAGGRPVPNEGTLPNHGVGKATRFAFFGDPVVPVLYAADSPGGAVHESVLHDAEPGSFVPRAWWLTKVLSVIEVTRDLRVVSFHSDGLRRFGLYPRDLTDTDVTRYPHTVRWAEAAWRTGADGVAYMCRHHNASKAVCLFGSDAGRSLRGLLGHPDARAFSVPEDAAWLAELAAAVRVVLRP